MQASKDTSSLENHNLQQVSPLYLPPRSLRASLCLNEGTPCPQGLHAESLIDDRCESQQARDLMSNVSVPLEAPGRAKSFGCRYVRTLRYDNLSRGGASRPVAEVPARPFTVINVSNQARESESYMHHILLRWDSLVDPSPLQPFRMICTHLHFLLPNKQSLSRDVVAVMGTLGTL